MYLSIMDTVQTFLDDLGQQIVDFAFGWLMKISPMMQALVLIGLSILSIIEVPCLYHEYSCLLGLLSETAIIP